MADVKLGNKTFEGVSGVKLDTTDGGTVTFENVDLSPIVEAIKSVGGTVESETVDGVAEVIVPLIDPWELAPSTGTDLIGDYSAMTIYRLKKNYNKRKLYYFNEMYGTSYDLSEFQSDTKMSPNNYNNLVPANGAKRVILPELYPTYRESVNAARSPYLLCSTAPVKIYLSKKYSNPDNYNRITMSTYWIMSANNSVTEQIVKCPKNMEIPYYLNKFTKITVESMVGIFENLIDNSNGETTLTLTLGTDNLAKLTEEQMDIARQKGWNLA